MKRLTIPEGREAYNELDRLTGEYLRLKVLVDEYDTKFKTVKNQMRAVCSGAQIKKAKVTGASISFSSRKTGGRIDADALVADHPDLAEKYRKPSGKMLGDECSKTTIGGEEMKWSESTKALDAALAKAQAEIQPVIKNAIGGGWSYAGLEAVMEKAQAALSANGITINQGGDIVGEKWVMVTRLAHAGEWLITYFPNGCRSIQTHELNAADGKRFNICTSIRNTVCTWNSTHDGEAGR